MLSPAAEASITDDIRSMIWAKLLVNSVFSGLGAVAGQTYAEVVANPAGKAVALRMWREGYEVGLRKACGPEGARRRGGRTRRQATKRRSPPP